MRPRPRAPAPPPPARPARPRVQRTEADFDRGSFSWGQCGTCQEEAHSAPSAPVIQRMSEPGVSVGCSTCDESDAPAEREADRAAESSGPIPMREAARGGEPSSSLRSALDSHAGRGDPLPEAVRETLEPRFKADLSDVRVHADGEAHRMATSLGATAFTYGSDIYFREGAYDPSGHEGRKTLAHEVAHTVQQSGASHTIQRRVVTGEAAAAFLRHHGATLEVQGTMSTDPSRRDVHRAILGQTATIGFTSRSLAAVSHGSAHASMRPSGRSRWDYLPRWHLELPSGATRDYEPMQAITVELNELGRYRIAALARDPGGDEVWLTRFIEVERRLDYTSRESADIAGSEYREFGQHALLSTFDAALREAIIAEQDQAGVGHAMSMSGTRPRRPPLRMSGPPNPVMLDGRVEGLQFDLRDGERSPRRGVSERIDWFVVFRGADGTPQTSGRRFGTDPVPFSFAGLEMVGYRLQQRTRVARLSFGEGRAPSWLTVVARVRAPSGIVQEAKREQFFVDEHGPRELLRERVEAARAETGGRMIPMRAAHFDTAGRRTPLHLYIAYQPNRMYVVFDLTLGAQRGRYEGMALRTLLQRIGGRYPPGYLYAEVEPNELGIVPQAFAVEATGTTESARLAGGLGAASLGLAAAGILALVIPGAQPLAPFFFGASSVAGGASSAISLSENLGADRVDGAAVALDLLSLAGAIVGASAARVSPFTNAGRGLRAADLALTAVDGVVFSASLADELHRAAIAEGTDHDRIRHVMVVLAQGIVSGGLMFQGARSTAGELRAGIRRPTARARPSEVAGASEGHPRSGDEAPRRETAVEERPAGGERRRAVLEGMEAPAGVGVEVQLGGSRRRVFYVDGPDGRELGLCTNCESLQQNISSLLGRLDQDHRARPRLVRLLADIRAANESIASGAVPAAHDRALQYRFARRLRRIASGYPLPEVDAGGGTRVASSELAARRPVRSSPRAEEGVDLLDAATPALWADYRVYYARAEAELRLGVRSNGPRTWADYWRFRMGPVRGHRFARRLGTEPLLDDFVRRTRAPRDRVEIGTEVWVERRRPGETRRRRPDALVMDPSTHTATVYFLRSHNLRGARRDEIMRVIEADIAEALVSYGGTIRIRRESMSRYGESVRVNKIVLTYDASYVDIASMRAAFAQTSHRRGAVSIVMELMSGG